MLQNIPYTFIKKDVIDNFVSDVQYENWLAVQLRAKRIVQVRKGLYVVLDITGEPLTTKFEVASKISEDAFVCYHSALEYYGVANQVFNTITVGSKSRFNTFSFEGVEYQRKQSKNPHGVIYITTAGVRITTLERTVVDCIDKIDLAGGIDELLAALEQIRLLDERKLLEILNAHDCVFLYQKAGYILQYYKEKFNFSDGFFAQCKSRLTNQVKYFLSDEFDVVYNAEWRLMAPKNLLLRVNGGY